MSNTAWKRSARIVLVLLFGVAGAGRSVSAESTQAQVSAASNLISETDNRAAQVESKAVAWRRDLHEHPELSNREFRMAKIVADHLRGLGTERMLPALRQVAGADAVQLTPLTTTSEDFAFYQQEIPGFFFYLGVNPKGADPSKIEPNHSPRFFADEAAIGLGIRALATIAVDFLQQSAK